MDTPIRNLETLDWVAGHPALDFVNTVSWAFAGHPDYLHGYADLLAWTAQADLISPQDRRALSEGSGHAQANAFKEAQALRESLHAIFRAIAEERGPPQAALDHLNAVVQKTVRWRRLSLEGHKVRGDWNFAGAPPGALLGPVAWKAVELLEDGPLERVKECHPGCAWLFLDTSRNSSRRWCSMQTCGNDAKVRRFRKRQKTGAIA